MAIVTTWSNHGKFQALSEFFNAYVFKIILMNNTFTFDKDTHATLSDIAADQLATAYGYTQNDKTLANIVITEDDVNDRVNIAWDDVSWSAAGGSIGPSGAAIILGFDVIEATEFFTTAIDRTFTGGGTHWTNGDLGTTFDETTDLSLVSDATGQYCKITFTDIGTALVAGGRYRLQYDYSETLAGYEFKINGAALQVLGDAVAGTAQTIDFIADESFTGAHELRIYSKTNAAAAGDFDNFSLKELGTIIHCTDFGTDYTVTDGTSLLLENVIIRGT
ncbi:MAG: hypothetical protein JRF53_00545 [Deltaproteobacteria bacterium]|nr:hypothetical protein [Deltaproteobacteria bacterium]